MTIRRDGTNQIGDKPEDRERADKQAAAQAARKNEAEKAADPTTNKPAQPGQPTTNRSDDAEGTTGTELTSQEYRDAWDRLQTSGEDGLNDDDRKTLDAAREATGHNGPGYPSPIPLAPQATAEQAGKGEPIQG